MTIPYERERMPPEAMIAAAREFLETIRKRRTVRDFAPDPVPDEVLALAIEAANLAPSGANMQPWKFVVVKDRELKKRIRMAAEEEEFENYNGRMPDEWLRGARASRPQRSVVSPDRRSVAGRDVQRLRTRRPRSVSIRTSPRAAAATGPS